MRRTREQDPEIMEMETVQQARVQIDETRRLICVVDAQDDEGGILVELPEEFAQSEMWNWVLDERDQLVHDPLPEPIPEPSELQRVEARTSALEDEAMMTLLALADVYEMIAGGN